MYFCCNAINKSILCLKYDVNTIYLFMYFCVNGVKSYRKILYEVAI